MPYDTDSIGGFLSSAWDASIGTHEFDAGYATSTFGLIENSYYSDLWGSGLSTVSPLATLYSDQLFSRLGNAFELGVEAGDFDRVSARFAETLHPRNLEYVARSMSGFNALTNGLGGGEWGPGFNSFTEAGAGGRALGLLELGLLVSPIKGGGAADDLIGAGARFGGRGGDDFVTLYRAVEPEEFFDIMKTGDFRSGSRTFDGVVYHNTTLPKQFGFDFDEVLRLADSPALRHTAAVIETRIPRNLLDKLDLTPVDSSILRSGSVTVPQFRLELFNSMKTTPIHKF